MKTLVALILGVVSLAVGAQTAFWKEAPRPANVTALQHYFGTLDVGLFVCRLSVKLTPKQNNGLKDPDAKPEFDSSDFRLCIKQTREGVTSTYEAAVATVKKPAAKAALKEHLVLGIGALEAIAPQMDERAIDYERRTVAAKLAVDQQKIRFELAQ